MSGKRTSVVGVTPQEIRLQLMKGNGNLIGSKQHTELIASTYQHTFKGLRPRFTSRALELDMQQSCSTGIVVPDPRLMTQIKDRRKKYDDDLKRVT